FERADPWFSARQEKQGVTIITLKEDAETEPFVAGDRVVFQYSGWVTSGRMFATSRRGNGKPQNYIAPGSMIPGWTFGTAGMSQGDWRKFIVPSDLAYRDRSAANGAIPPNSTLVF